MLPSSFDEAESPLNHVSENMKKEGRSVHLREMGNARRHWDCWLYNVGLMPTRGVP